MGQFSIKNEHLASGGQRFLNYIIDIIIIYIIIFLLMFLVGIIATLFGSLAVFDWMQNISDLESYLVFFGVFIPYYTFFEGFTSRSIGKYITKTKVVMQDGSHPSYSTTFRRTLCRIIPFEQFSFFGSQSRGWHDSISDTYVVNKSIFDESYKQFYEFEEIGKPQDI